MMMLCMCGPGRYNDACSRVPLCTRPDSRMTSSTPEPATPCCPVCAGPVALPMHRQATTTAEPTSLMVWCATHGSSHGGESVPNPARYTNLWP